MVAPKQPKRVSWPPEMNLRQPQSFLIGGCSRFIGLNVQDQVQARSSWPCLSTEMDSDSMPPGFEAPPSIYQPKRESPKFPLIVWKQPQKFILNPDWVVAEGGESEEFKVQNKRQLGVLEAVYASSFSIPPNPFIGLEVKDSCNDDAQTPLIPVTAMEDGEPDATILEDPKSILNTSTSGSISSLLHLHHPQVRIRERAMQTVESPIEKPLLKIVPGVEPDVAAAASVVFTAILRSSDKGSLIDRELLVKILSDPRIIEKLAADCGTPEQATPLASPTVLPEPAVPALPASPAILALSPSTVTPAPALSPSKQVGFSKILDVPLQQSPLCSHSSPLAVTPSEFHLSSVNVHLTAKTLEVSPSKDLSYCKSLIRQHGAKDANYYKSLIQQHGGEKHDVTACNFGFQSCSVNNLSRDNVDSRKQCLRQRDIKSRFQKPCVYFGSPKGCMRGDHCFFQHDFSPSLSSDRHGEKRIKLDKRIL